MKRPPPAYGRRVDKSHAGIVKAFKAAGCSVAVIQSGVAGLPDLALGVAGRTHLVECKPPPTNKTGRQTAKSSPRATQVDFARKWRGGPIHVVHTGAEALELVALLRMTANTATMAAIALRKSGLNDVARGLTLNQLPKENELVVSDTGLIPLSVLGLRISDES